MRKSILIVSFALILSLLCGAAMAEHIYVSDASEIYDAYNYILDGVQYQLPTPMKELMDNGWHITHYGDNAESERLDAKTYTIYDQIETDTAKIRVYIANPTDTALPITECYVIRMDINGDTYDEKEKAAAELFSLPDGMQVGSTVADYMKANGLTLRYIESDDESTLVSYWDGEQSWYGGQQYFFLKDGKFFSYAGGKDSPSEALSFDYKLDDSIPSLTYDYNTSKFGENDITYYFDGPVTDEGSKIYDISINLVMAPREDHPAPVPVSAGGAPQAPAADDGSWVCENGHAGNTGNFCTECGSPRPARKAFCASCGYQFEGERTRFCPNCGAAQ